MMKFLICLILALPVAGITQSRDNSPPVTVRTFARAIAYAEGFGRPHAIPTRYHNPGDLKAVRGFAYPGQKAVGKAGHIIFRTDADGWAALEHQIQRTLDGESRIYSIRMSLRDYSRRYAGNSRRWCANVARALTANADVTLAELFEIAPVITFPPNPDWLKGIL